MLTKVADFWWRLYFSAYWSAYNWKALNPRSNAIYLLRLISLVNFSALLQIALLFGLKRLSAIPFILFCVLPAFLLPYWSIEANKNYKQRFENFEYLKADEFSRKRNSYVIAIVVAPVFFNAGVAIIRNITDSQ